MDAQIQRGEAVKRPARFAIEDATALYLEHVEGEGRRPRTLTQYRYDLKAFLGFATRKHARFLDQVTLFLAEQYRATLRKGGYAPKTIQHRLVIVKQFVLFLAKAYRNNGNLSLASRSLAPPGYSYHGVGDFDIGQAGYGAANFTDRFTETNVFRSLSRLGYVDLRYEKDNRLGVRFEPWHIKAVPG